MKKFFMFAAMASVALVSCVKNETAPSIIDDQVAIEFATPVMAPSVKAATEVANPYPEDSKFAVWAYYVADEVYTNMQESQEYMNMVTTAKDGTTWKPEGATYYWPKNGTLTFAAYSPVSSNGTYDYTANGLQISGYQVPTDPAQQADLLFSERAYNQKVGMMDTETENDPYTGVTLDFKHALTSILFRVTEAEAYESGNPKTVITVNKIEVLQVNAKGSFNQGLEDGPASVTAAPETVPGWTMNDPAVLSDYVAFNGAQALTTSKCYLASKDTDPTKVKANTTDLILLPQPLDGQAVLKISYTINNQTTTVSQVSTFNLKDITVGSQWYRGQRYTYDIDFKLSEITFEPTVTVWAESIDVDVPTI